MSLYCHSFRTSSFLYNHAPEPLPAVRWCIHSAGCIRVCQGAFKSTTNIIFITFIDVFQYVSLLGTFFFIRFYFFLCAPTERVAVKDRGRCDHTAEAGLSAAANQELLTVAGVLTDLECQSALHCPTVCLSLTL